MKGKRGGRNPGEKFGGRVKGTPNKATQDLHAKVYSVTWDGWTKQGESGSKVHPSQKPIKLSEDILNDVTDPGARILDLFGGSGSTLIACEKTNRRCFMMELDPHYCDVIVARWEKYTGQKAELLNGEQSQEIAQAAKPKKANGKTKTKARRRANSKTR